MRAPVSSTNMAIKIDEREFQGTTLLVVTGRMTTNECQGDLKNVVRSLIERGRKQIVIDLEAVPEVCEKCLVVVIVNREGQ